MNVGGIEYVREILINKPVWRRLATGNLKVKQEKENCL